PGRRRRSSQPRVDTRLPAPEGPPRGGRGVAQPPLSGLVPAARPALPAARAAARAEGRRPAARARRAPGRARLSLPVAGRLVLRARPSPAEPREATGLMRASVVIRAKDEAASIGRVLDILRAQ